MRSMSISEGNIQMKLVWYPFISGNFCLIDVYTHDTFVLLNHILKGMVMNINVSSGLYMRYIQVLHIFINLFFTFRQSCSRHVYAYQTFLVLLRNQRFSTRGCSSRTPGLCHRGRTSFWRSVHDGPEVLDGSCGVGVHKKSIVCLKSHIDIPFN